MEFGLDDSAVCCELSVIYGPSGMTLAVPFVWYIMPLEFSD